MTRTLAWSISPISYLCRCFEHFLLYQLRDDSFIAQSWSPISSLCVYFSCQEPWYIFMRLIYYNGNSYTDVSYFQFFGPLFVYPDVSRLSSGTRLPLASQSSFSISPLISGFRVLDPLIANVLHQLIQSWSLRIGAKSYSFMVSLCGKKQTILFPQKFPLGMKS